MVACDSTIVRRGFGNPLPLFPGKWITIEGPDGCGKGVQIQNILTWMKEHGHQASAHRSPGSTPLGSELRTLMKNRKDLKMCMMTIQTMMMADLMEMIEQIVKPECALGHHVIADRTNLISGIAYGLAGSLTMKEVELLHALPICLQPPPLYVIVLLGEPEKLKARQHGDIEVQKDGTVIEKACRFQDMGGEYHQRVYENYRKVAIQMPWLTSELGQLYGHLSKFVPVWNNERYANTSFQKLAIWEVDATGSVEEVGKKISEIVAQIVAAP
jgi:dTMP kinase